MKTTILIIITVLLFVAPAYAGEIIVRPMVPDFAPGDGFLDAGSSANPYILTDSDTGREIGRMESMVPDLDPNDNFMTPGSFANPWVIETD